MVKTLLRKLGYPRYDLKEVFEGIYDLHIQRFPLDKWNRVVEKKENNK